MCYSLYSFGQSVQSAFLQIEARLLHFSNSLVLQESELPIFKPPREQVCIGIRMKERLKKDCRKNHNKLNKQPYRIYYVDTGLRSRSFVIGISIRNPD